MSDIMLFGVLRMPMPDNPADMGVLEWAQVKDRMRQAADDIEKDRAAIEGHINYIDVLEAERDALRAELAAMERRARTFEAANVEILAERDALRAALREIAAVQYGLQGIIDECGGDRNKENYFVRKYFGDEVSRYQQIARAALNKGGGDEL